MAGAAALSTRNATATTMTKPRTTMTKQRKRKAGGKAGRTSAKKAKTTVARKNQQSPSHVTTTHRKLFESDDESLYSHDDCPSDENLENGENNKEQRKEPTTTNLNLDGATVDRDNFSQVGRSSTTVPRTELVSETTNTIANATASNTGVVSISDCGSTITNNTAGNISPVKSITYDYIQKSKYPNREKIIQQLLILGIRDITDAVIDHHVNESKYLRETAMAFATNRMKSTMIAVAQKLNIKYNGRILCHVKDLANWWASLSEEEAVMNGEVMFRIQHAPFEIGKWARDLENEFMALSRIEYHVPPKQMVRLSGCVEQLINQQRVNMNKTLTRACKDNKSHGMYVTVRSVNGSRRTDRRMPGQYFPWMLRGRADKEHEQRKVSTVVLYMSIQLLSLTICLLF
jgi:hypothetical protein